MMEEQIKARISYKNPLRFEYKQVDKEKETFEHNGNKYNIEEDKINHANGELRLYYRAGDPDPQTWTRYDGKFSNRAMWEMEHDQSAIEGILNAFGIEGAGSLQGSQWAIILGVVGMMIVGFIYFYPQLISLIGM